MNTSLHEKQGQTPQFTQTEKQSSLTYFQETYKYKQFIVEKVSETFSGSDTLRLQGYFRYDTAIDNEKNIPTQIKANILLQEIDGNFLVQTFDQEDSKINAFIQTTLAQKPLTIA